MRKIQVEDIESGMILERDLLGSAGNILLNKGTALSAAMGRRLKNWGITNVFVNGGEEEEVTEEVVLSVSPGEIKKHLEEKFGKYLEHPIMRQIFKAVYNHKCHG